MARAGESWMHELMAACQEISWDDVEALRSCGDLLVTNAPAKIDAEAPAPPISADDEAPEKYQVLFWRRCGRHVASMTWALSWT